MSSTLMTMSRTRKWVILFSAIAAAVGIAALLVILDNQPVSSLFQRLTGQNNDNIQGGGPPFAFRANYMTSLAVGEDGTFNGIANGGKEPYTYHWKFSDGITLSGQNVTRNFDSPGVYYFNLTVTDADGKQVRSSNLVTTIVE